MHSLFLLYMISVASTAVSTRAHTDCHVLDDDDDDDDDGMRRLPYCPFLHLPAHRINKKGRVQMSPILPIPLSSRTGSSSR